MIFTSNVQGLKDITVPFQESLNQRGAPQHFNAFTFYYIFENPVFTKQDIAKSLDKLFLYWNRWSNNEKNELQKSWIHYATEKFKWNDEISEKYRKLYDLATTPLSPSEKKIIAEFRERYNIDDSFISSP